MLSKEQFRKRLLANSKIVINYDNIKNRKLRREIDKVVDTKYSEYLEKSKPYSH